MKALHLRRGVETYGLTSDEVDLMWDTAPFRIPVQRPHSSAASLRHDGQFRKTRFGKYETGDALRPGPGGFSVRGFGKLRSGVCTKNGPVLRNSAGQITNRTALACT